MQINPKPIAAKWGPALAEGFTALPNALVRRQKEIGLEPLDFCILAILISFWWEADSPAFPGKDRIAASLGVHKTTVRRRIAELERRGLIRRVSRHRGDGRNLTNYYILDGLVRETSQVAAKRVPANSKGDAADASIS